MTANLRQKGRYELFLTDHDHRILVLDGERWFAWIHGDEGEILVHSDSDHDKSKTLDEGRFYMVDFEDEPDFRDVPHLFLEKGDSFREVILPNGLPTEKDYQKKVIGTDETVSKGKLEKHIQ